MVSNLKQEEQRDGEKEGGLAVTREENSRKR